MLKSMTGRRREPSSGTAAKILAAAQESLRLDGFAGASARAIARRADCNQALVFYHFGSLADLYLAVLDEISRTREARYAELVLGAATPAAMVDAARTIFREDLELGHLTVLVELIGGSRSVPGMPTAIAERLVAWRELAQQGLDRHTGRNPLTAMVPTAELADAAVALFLGLEVLTHLEDSHTSADRLFGRAVQLAGVATTLGLIGRST